jgi:hypothetical protein
MHSQALRLKSPKRLFSHLNKLKFYLFSLQSEENLHTHDQIVFFIKLAENQNKLRFSLEIGKIIEKYLKNICFLCRILASSGLIAQWIEHPPSKRAVAGSSPAQSVFFK